jgi:hypothetical protein
MYFRRIEDVSSISARPSPPGFRAARSEAHPCGHGLTLSAAPACAGRDGLQPPHRAHRSQHHSCASTLTTPLR